MKRLSKCLSLIAFVLLTACGGSGDSDPDDVTKQAIGRIHLSSPVVGAQVKLLDANGNQIGATERPTDAGGVFHLAVPDNKAARFRITATGGTYQGQPFKDTLVLDVENFVIDEDVLYANAATTMISRYIDLHKGVGVEEASKKVKQFLQIPVTSSAGFDVANPKQTYFSHDVLLSQAAQSGATSLNAYLNGVMDEMASGTPSHSFARGPLLGGSDFSLLGFLADALAKDGVGLIFEKAASFEGLNANAEILAQLHEINAKLDNLIKLTYELISGQKDELLQNITLSLAKDVTFIQGQYKHLTTVAQAASDQCDPKDQANYSACENFRNMDLDIRKKKIEGYIDAILNETTGVEARLASIAAQHLAMTVTEPGLIVRANDFLRTKRPFDAPITDPRLIELHDYYKAIQEMGVHLLVEAYSYRAHNKSSKATQTPPLQNADNGGQVALDLYLYGSLPKQQARIEEVRYKDEDVIEQLRTGLVWLRAPVTNLPFAEHSEYDNYIVLARRACEQKATQKFGGHANWRLPTEAELHAVVKGEDSPNNSGNAGDGTGIFEWFVKKGFKQATTTGNYSEGFWVGQPAVAYFSNTRSGDSYFEALWDYGVDSAHIQTVIPYQPHQYRAKTAGAWCVANKDS
ncbi:Lcl domain-containing protein [Ottowia thiooxydans]|uniref:Lcl C-terminal domain-containing protein n=1 Tax=Ottowia thiooxydans TaxID=219182 RepID=A0ABV2Q695_9BURK